MPPAESFRKGTGGSNEQVFGTAAAVERNADHSSRVPDLFPMRKTARKAGGIRDRGRKPVLRCGKIVNSGNRREVGEQGERFSLHAVHL